jgi:shikimate dehydrogenase
MIEASTTVVNTTSLGMVGAAEFRVPLDGLRRGMVVTDLVYTPLRTRLLQAAEEAGCITVDGLGMLLHQGVPGFERWFGQRPEVDEATRAAVLG